MHKSLTSGNRSTLPRCAEGVVLYGLRSRELNTDVDDDIVLVRSLSLKGLSTSLLIFKRQMNIELFT